MQSIKYSKQAFKYLSKLPKPKAEQIVTSINKLPDNEGDIKKMKGIDNLYRLRVGDYRVLFSPELSIIKIERIGARGDVYNGLK